MRQKLFEMRPKLFHYCCLRQHGSRKWLCHLRAECDEGDRCLSEKVAHVNSSSSVQLKSIFRFSVARS